MSRSRGLVLVLGLGLTACAAEDAEPNEEELALRHCLEGPPVDPRDASMTGELVTIIVDAGDPNDPSDDVRDVQVPVEMVDWMNENNWQQIHDDWHNVRLVDQFCGRSNPPVEQCPRLADLEAKGLYRAALQQGAPGNSLEFLAMHRHMLLNLGQAFPSHVDAIAGFSRVPRIATDSENLMPWQEIRWSENQLAALDKLEHIEDHIDEFPTEDDLGFYIQGIAHWTPQTPFVLDSDPTSGIIHQALHSQWSVPGSPVRLAIGPQLILNASFWRLHGWIDDVWERYRQAKGLRTDDADYQTVLADQCAEMHRLDDRYFDEAHGEHDHHGEGE